MNAGASPRGKILLVDDDPWVGRLVAQVLAPLDVDLTCVLTGGAAIEALDAGFRGVVILDEYLPDTRGSAVLRTMRDRGSTAPIIFLTAFGSAALELRTITDGATDFVDKASLAQRLPSAVQRATRQASPGSDNTYGIAAESPAMRAVMLQIGAALPSRVSVVVRGESGTGKELVARALHEHGPRSRGPFVAMNCAGIPNDLLESELFGYEKGAFTGATQRKPGRFDLAQGGTLLLDEIGDMPLALQGKILRVLQEGEYQRLGGTETVRSDVRIVSATHRDLEADAAAGRFRLDLFFRLSQFTIHLPPLRDRKADIPALAVIFAERAARREGKEAPKISSRLVEVLAEYNFPGNIRELENLISFAVLTGQNNTMSISDLPGTFLRALDLQRIAAQPHPPLGRDDPAPPPAAGAPPSSLGNPEIPKFPTLEEVEQDHIARAMVVAQGNKVEAARLLGISRMTLYRKLGEE